MNESKTKPTQNEKETQKETRTLNESFTKSAFPAKPTVVKPPKKDGK